MYGLLGSAGGRGRVKSSTEGSGVVMRNELMYLVSAISRFSRISSRSSMSNATRCVSLKVVREPHKIYERRYHLPDREQALNVNFYPISVPCRVQRLLFIITTPISLFPVFGTGVTTIPSPSIAQT